MISILLIDDETEWLKLIRRALPEYAVDQAQSFDEAMALLGGDTTYDVAIVDLNLLETGSDRLGGVILEIMRDQYPSIRRIALTGMHPTAVKEILDRYGVDDLLLKDINIDLAAVRKVVGKALGRTANVVPPDLMPQKSELLASVKSWEAHILQGLDQRTPTLRNDILAAKSVGRTAEDSARELAALEARRRNLTAECAELIKLVSGIRTDQDMVHARQEFKRLKTVFGSQTS